MRDEHLPAVYHFLAVSIAFLSPILVQTTHVPRGEWCYVVSAGQTIYALFILLPERTQEYTYEHLSRMDIYKDHKTFPSELVEFLFIWSFPCWIQIAKLSPCDPAFVAYHTYPPQNHGYIPYVTFNFTFLLLLLWTASMVSCRTSEGCISKS